jgi:hypothetical protein
MSHFAPAALTAIGPLSSYVRIAAVPPDLALALK